jgi:AcrR family transcriptional regulator
MSEQQLPTKERIVKAAGEIFGRKGFSGATIRQIAQAARVNTAAINYHFRDKEGLYSAVLENVFKRGFTRFPSILEEDMDSAPEKRLQSFVRGMFYRLQRPEGWGGMTGQGRLIARELLDPSPPFENILDRYIRPHKDLLVSIIAEIAGSTVEPRKLLQCAISIIGQCIYYTFASSVISKIGGELTPRQDNLDQLADFVYTFSLGGINQIKDEPTPTRHHT